MNNMAKKKDLSTEQLTLLQGEYEDKKKSKGIMYVLRFFFGGIGGHRYYLGDIGYAIGTTLTLGGLGFWALVDVFLIGKRLQKKNGNLESELIEDVKIHTKAQ